MNRKWYILILLIAAVVLYLSYTMFLNKIATKYAVNFSKVFSAYDISVIDAYLTDETKIYCNNKCKTYAQLRTNVENACNERKYEFEDSYGHANSKAKNDIQKVIVYLFGNLNGESMGEVNVLMSLRKIGLYKFKIVSLECDDNIFEYIFYGVNN